MKKVLDFLEANVQWFALALGGLYIGWMAWSFLVSSPVQVEVNNQKLSPGEVDKYIVDNAANDLQQKVNEGGVPKLTAPRWVAAFSDEMAYRNKPALAWAVPMFPADMTEKLDIKGGGPVHMARPDVLVERLPVPPPAVMMEFRTGLSTVEVPGGLAQAPKDNAGGAPVVPVAGPGGADKPWVTIKYRIPMVDMSAAFRDVRLPVNQFETAFYQVELWRQEMRSDGTWSPETMIRPLPTEQLQPLPADKAAMPAKQAFIQWAIDNTAAIIQPRFYTVTAGDPWAAPGEVVKEVEKKEEEPQEAFDPAKYVDATHAELMKLTVEQRQAVAQYKRKKAEEERQGKGRPGGKGGAGGLGGGRGGGGGGRGGAFGPNDGERGSQSEGDPDSIGRPNQMPEEERNASRNQEEAKPINPNFPMAVGEFDPRQQNDDTIGWAHDDTVQPGKTYRYIVIYRIKNPVWNTQNITKTKELADTFALVSDKTKTQWSTEVTIPTTTNFFVIGVNLKGEAAQVQVFRWQGGALQTKMFDITPGDAVGRPENGVDFSTGWTMVDLRSNPKKDGDRDVILMDPGGRLHARASSERDNPEFKKLKEAANAAAAGAGTPADAVAGTGDR